VARAALVHPHLDVRPATRERPRRSGVVEVDVSEQDARRRLVAERLEQRVDGRRRARVDDHVVERIAADDLRDPLVTDVDLTHGAAP
jgi:hypothetical protein